jgi:hypothetical protein
MIHHIRRLVAGLFALMFIYVSGCIAVSTFQALGAWLLVVLGVLALAYVVGSWWVP